MDDYVLRLQIVDYRRGTIAKHNFRSLEITFRTFQSIRRKNVYNHLSAHYRYHWRWSPSEYSCLDTSCLTDTIFSFKRNYSSFRRFMLLWITRRSVYIEQISIIWGWVVFVFIDLNLLFTVGGWIFLLDEYNII